MAQQVKNIKGPKELEDALQATGFGKFNIFIIIVCGGCLMSVIVETMSMSFVIPSAQCDLELNLSQRGILYSISFLGVVSSSYFWGYLADTKGRRTILIISLFSSATVSLLTSFVPWAQLFILGRFINGALIGGPSAVIYAYVGEFHDNIIRPKAVAWISTFVALGNMYLPAMSWILLPMEFKVELSGLGIYLRPWRVLMIANMMPSIIFGTLLLFLPESPKFLLTQNKNEVVLDILKKMFRMNTNKSGEEYPVSKVLWKEQEHINHVEKENIISSMWKQTVPLFKRRHIFQTLSVSAMQFGIFLTNAATMMWLPEILNSLAEYSRVVDESEVGLCSSLDFYENFKKYNYSDINSIEQNNGQASLICFDSVNTDVFVSTLTVSAIYVVVYFIVGFVINILGKKKIIVCVLVTTSIAGLIAQNLNGYYINLIMIGIFVMGAILIGVVNAMVVDLYPTQIRAMALAISLMFGRLGAMTGSNLAGSLFYQYCEYLFYCLFAINMAVTIITILLPEKNKIKVIEQC